MEYGLIYIVLCVAVGAYASSKGRNPFGFFVLSLLVTPLVGALICLISLDLKNVKPSPNTHVKCPDCRELVLKDARKCKHCGCALIPQP